MDDDIINIINGVSYKQISSEEEYNKKLEEFKIRLTKFDVKKHPYEIARNAYEFYQKFMKLWDWAEGIGLFDKTFCNEKRMKLINGINDSNLKKKLEDFIRKRMEK